MKLDQSHKMLRAFGHEFDVLVNSEHTRGASCVLRAFASPGNDVPLHVHRFEDEIFIVESGELEVNRGGEIIRLRKGDAVYLPKNIPHAPRAVGSERAQVLAICVPGGFDHYIAACAEEWSKPQPSFQRLDQIAARFGQEFLTPESPSSSSPELPSNESGSSKQPIVP
ncbi:MAG: cupin domain-containing protein [Verrucomicrobia bacterium]|nr:cupin domain-containing protein [Verrucomicrobiota bacterium]